MIQREVTVGRAPDSDILYGHECAYVSNKHALIYFDGKQLIFKDISTNGTLINNIRIHHQSVAINAGDTILLAGKYLLTWDRIAIFFSIGKQSTQINEVFLNGDNIIEPPSPSVKEIKGKKETVNIEAEIARFNWGAFFLYPLWGFANGMWWTFLIAMFCWWSAFIPNIIFGIMGSKWAWENKKWRDVNHFMEVQESWKKWGIGIFLANIFLWILFWVIVMAVSM